MPIGASSLKYISAIVEKNLGCLIDLIDSVCTALYDVCLREFNADHSIPESCKIEVQQSTIGILFTTDLAHQHARLALLTLRAGASRAKWAGLW
jgi:hypothetical protein